LLLSDHLVMLLYLLAIVVHVAIDVRSRRRLSAASRRRAVGHPPGFGWGIGIKRLPASVAVGVEQLLLAIVVGRQHLLLLLSWRVILIRVAVGRMHLMDGRRMRVVNDGTLVVECL